MIAAGAALLLAAAIAAVAVAMFGGRGSTSASLAPDYLGLVDPATNSLRGAISMAGKPPRLHVDGRDVWVTSDDARTVSLVRGSTPSIANVIPIGEFPSDFAVGAGGVWVIDRVRGRLVKVSAEYASVVGSVAIGSSQTVSSTDDRYDVDGWSVATGARGVWITDGSSVLRRADPATGRIAASYDEGMPLNAVALDANGVWAISGANATVLRIDPLTGKVTARIAIVGSQSAESAYPIAVATGLGSVWVLNATAATVTRIDPVQAGITTTRPLHPDCGHGVGRQVLAAQRAGAVSGVHERVVGERQELLAQRVVEQVRELIGTPAERCAQIGAADVADEQRVAREHGIRAVLVLLGVEDENRDRLRRMARRFEHGQPDAPQLHFIAVGHRRERVLGAGLRPEVDRRPDAVAELEVAGDEVGVHVGQEHLSDRAPELVGVGDVLLDVALRIDHGRVASYLVGDQVGGVRETAEVVLLVDHRWDPFGWGTIRM